MIPHGNMDIHKGLRRTKCDNILVNKSFILLKTHKRQLMLWINIAANCEVYKYVKVKFMAVLPWKMGKKVWNYTVARFIHYVWDAIN